MENRQDRRQRPDSSMVLTGFLMFMAFVTAGFGLYVYCYEYMRAFAPT